MISRANSVIDCFTSAGSISPPWLNLAEAGIRYVCDWVRQPGSLRALGTCARSAAATASSFPSRA